MSKQRDREGADKRKKKGWEKREKKRKGKELHRREEKKEKPMRNGQRTQIRQTLIQTPTDTQMRKKERKKI